MFKLESRLETHMVATLYHANVTLNYSGAIILKGLSICNVERPSVCGDAHRIM